MTPDEEQKNDCEGVPVELHSVVAKFGREVFDFVLATGLASQALEAAGQVVQRHASRKGLQAVMVLADQFGKVCGAYLARAGWDEATLAECDQAIRLAWGSRIEVASKIVH